MENLQHGLPMAELKNKCYMNNSIILQKIIDGIDLFTWAISRILHHDFLFATGNKNNSNKRYFRHIAFYVFTFCIGHPVMAWLWIAHE